LTSPTPVALTSAFATGAPSGSRRAVDDSGLCLTEVDVVVEAAAAASDEEAVAGRSGASMDWVRCR